eukprot:Colp12_sorted_trinity150504_noHs@30934
MRATVLILALLCVSCFAGPSERLKNAAKKRPIIGMFTQPNTEEEVFLPFGNSYLPASYVKWVESGGARVAPIHYNMTTEELEVLFPKLNGLLMPGGNSNISTASPYGKTVSFMLSLAKKANDNGVYFPVWGTCQGLEQQAVYELDDQAILIGFDGEDISLPVKFSKYGLSRSRMFKGAPKHVIESFMKPVTENLHSFGVSPADYEARKLHETYGIVATSVDRQGKEFITIWEGLKYPIYGVQFHPERNQFEWDRVEPLDHTLEGIQAMQWLANFFVQEARRNGNHFESEAEEAQHLIYNSAPLYTTQANRYYEQSYIWP